MISFQMVTKVNMRRKHSCVNICVLYNGNNYMNVHVYVHLCNYIASVRKSL
jgi:hypothetical protein